MLDITCDNWIQKYISEKCKNVYEKNFLDRLLTLRKEVVRGSKYIHNNEEIIRQLIKYIISCVLDNIDDINKIKTNINNCKLLLNLLDSYATLHFQE